MFDTLLQPEGWKLKILNFDENKSLFFAKEISHLSRQRLPRHPNTKKRDINFVFLKCTVYNVTINPTHCIMAGLV
jgi:hypothetical protein